MSYNYVVTAHKPTAVTHSIVGNFTSPTDLNLIISKCTRIEVHSASSEGLQPILDFPIYGRVSFMELYRPQGESQDLLFICTERFNFCILSFDARTGEIVTRANGDVLDRNGRSSEIGQIGVVDPDCRMIGLHLYEGAIKIIPMDQKGIKEAFNIRLKTIHVVDIKALYGCVKPTIAILYQDAKEARHVDIFEVLTGEKEREFGETHAISNVEAGASMIIPVPLPLGGFVIVGEHTIAYHNRNYKGSKSIPISPQTIMKTFGRIDQDGSRYLLGDYNGRIYLLVLDHNSGELVNMQLEVLGEVNTPSTISYLDNGVIYVGSSQADSQLIQLTSGKEEEGSGLRELETHANLGPIVDFCVVDLERQGQGQIVACSGSFKHGSIKVIRNGIGINEQASIELPGIKGLWSLREGEHDKYIVMSFVGETRVLSMTGEELGEIDINGFQSDEQTIFCGNVINNQFIQVTSKQVTLVNGETLEAVKSWTPSGGSKINVASCTSDQVLLGVGGGNLIYIEIVGNDFKEAGRVTMEHEISCVNISPLGDQKHSSLCAVGMWTDISVRLIDIPSMTPVNKEALGGEIIPRSVLLVTFEGSNYLLCALGDGTLFTFVLEGEKYEMKDRRKVSLGTQPLLLNIFKSNGINHVFASSDRPTVIYSNNKKLLYSNVNLKEVNCMCAFHSESFPDSLAIATDELLKIGTIDAIQKLHIRTIPFNALIRRIAHQPETNTFAVLAIKSELYGEQNFVHLIDDQTYEITSTYDLKPNENPNCLISLSFAASADTYYVVGTAYVFPDEAEPLKGRILLFQAIDKQLKLVSEVEVAGSVYDVNSFGGKLLVSVNSMLHIYNWSESKALELEATHHAGLVIALYLASRGDFIIVGDLMRSISLLVYKHEEKKIEHIARDQYSNWMTAVNMMDDETYLGAETYLNIFTVKKNSGAATDEERQTLDVVGQYHLGEFVNRFRTGSLVMKLSDSEVANLPTRIFGTVNGTIGIIATLSQEQYEFFDKVQTKLQSVIKGVGGFHHGEWRSFTADRKKVASTGFIDGDLIESFLDLKQDKMQEVARHLEVSVEDLTKKIETLQQALH